MPGNDDRAKTPPWRFLGHVVAFPGQKAAHGNHSTKPGTVALWREPVGLKSRKG